MTEGDANLTPESVPALAAIPQDALDWRDWLGADIARDNDVLDGVRGRIILLASAKWSFIGSRSRKG